MEKINFNKNWEFILEDELDAFNMFSFDKYGEASGAPARFYDNSNWQKIDLPHDYALDLPRSAEHNTYTGAYLGSRCHFYTFERRVNEEKVYNVGWYRKSFTLDKKLEGKRIFVEFEGIFRDAVVWVNGVYLDRHTSGYTSFVLDITDHLDFGEDNSIAVRVDCDQNEGWWYEGAGIYRNVYLTVCEPVYFKYNKTFVKTSLDGKVDVCAVLVNDTEERFNESVKWSVCDKDGNAVAEYESAVSVEPYQEKSISALLTVNAPALWSIEDPYLYTLKIQAAEEKQELRFGIRTVDFDAERGFLLNGNPVKIRGACVHQDFGGVGVALTDNLQFYKIRKLKEMGVNAYRSAHHAPSPVLLDACDELGMLFMDETRVFGTSPEAVRQLTDIIERDRNHPSIFIWSLGNEEHSAQNLQRGAELIKKVTYIAKSLDPTRPVTYGGNNGIRYHGANSASEVRGVNYIRLGGDCGDVWDKYHLEHPEQPIIGTEESSYVLSRGSGANDLENGILDCFGNVTMPWGSTPKGWVKYIEKRDWFSGSFMWTGFDYRGEPSPFVRNNSSSFGTIDLCGIEKPPFYYYKSWWTNEPVLKLAPHWNHKEGDTVKIAVYTNCDEVALSLNGRLLERRRVERFDSPVFEVKFEAGVLSAEGKYKGMRLYDELVTSNGADTVSVEEILASDLDSDVAIYELKAIDSDGNFCPLASDEVEIDAENGVIVGVGNGDPSCYDYERKPREEEAVFITELTDADTTVIVPQKKENEFVFPDFKYFVEESRPCFEDDFRIRRENLSLTEKHKILTATLGGVSDYQYLEFERLCGNAKVYLNGDLVGDNARYVACRGLNTNRPHRFYCGFKKGKNVVTVDVKYTEDDPLPIFGYVKIGREVSSPWRVRLHYGKARVFVKYADKTLFSLKAKKL